VQENILKNINALVLLNESPQETKKGEKMVVSLICRDRDAERFSYINCYVSLYTIKERYDR